MSKDYYKILEVDKTASADEIKAAFRRSAIKNHPDKGGDANKFKEVNEAYQTLSDENKRAQYDQFGQTFDGMGGGAGGQSPFGQGSGGFQNGNVNFEDLGDIFGNIFGGSRQQSRSSSAKSRGRDIEIDLTIDFMESVWGVKKEVELYKNIKCEKCNGDGAEPGTKVNTCSKCNGKGKVEKIQKSIFGAIRVAAVCEDCRGVGKKYEKECKKCRGEGIAKDSSKIEIKIPAGISGGETLRLSGQGEVGAYGAGAGDLYVNVRVKKHSSFLRDGYNIITQEKISFPDAALGIKKDITTVDGEVELKIPSGIQSSQILKLGARGVPFLHGTGRGDHLVEIVVEVPKKLSRKQKKMVEELKKELS
ncbi:MAG: molecular chaperone DnaJ [Parcubacteria group bacterium]|nr:molecular chaperone DnaJ [Parcubacteria group bacterium]